jgi:malonyl-CoA O-methyltransferase
MSVFDVGQVQKAFEVAASKYETHAGLQREVAGRCLAALAGRCAAPRGPVLDAGAGTGHVAAIAFLRGFDWNLVALDVAPSMCRLAARYSASVLVGDMMRLPLGTATVAAVVSSLALQWVDDPARALGELARVTRPGGWGVLATFGPQTLREMASAFGATDGDARVTRFKSQAELALMASQARWRVEECEEEVRISHHGNLGELMASIKAIGATDRRRLRRRGLTSPALFHRAEALYRAAHAGARKLPATWHVYYLILRKPG